MYILNMSLKSRQYDYVLTQFENRRFWIKHVIHDVAVSEPIKFAHQSHSVHILCFLLLTACGRRFFTTKHIYATINTIIIVTI